jgi:defect-in-organelle-trafficking protein DotC
MTTIAATLMILLSANVNSSTQKNEVYTLDELSSMDSSFVSEAQKLLDTDNETAQRYNAIEQIAMTVGAQHGYANRIKELEEKFQSIGDSLDQMIDFKTIMLTAYTGEKELFLLPPVVTETTGMSALSEDAKTLRITGTAFFITKPERLVLMPPTWREYLLLSNDIMVKIPHPKMLPENDAEKLIWKETLARGWIAGTVQADHEMNDRIEQLGSDYQGMIRYMRLVNEGKISEPIIAKVKDDVSGGGEEMRINDSTYRLTSQSSLLSNVKYWKPLILDNRESLRYDTEFE